MIFSSFEDEIFSTIEKTHLLLGLKLQGLMNLKIKNHPFNTRLNSYIIYEKLIFSSNFLKIIFK